MLIRELDLRLAHIGVNNENADSAADVSEKFGRITGLPLKEGRNSIFVGSDVEVMKHPNIGTHGHIAFQTDDLEKAIQVFEENGFSFDMDSVKFNSAGEKQVIYLQGEIAGFAIHISKA